MSKLTISIVMMEAIQGLFGGVAMHLATREMLGERADWMTGGAVVLAFAVAPGWVSGPAALVGHFASAAVAKRLLTSTK